MSSEEPKDWQPGDLVQIDPEHDPRFAACVLYVSEVRSWGAVGCVRIPEAPAPVEAWYRLPWRGGEKVGSATWVPAPRSSESESHA